MAEPRGCRPRRRILRPLPTIQLQTVEGNAIINLVGPSSTGEDNGSTDSPVGGAGNAHSEGEQGHDVLRGGSGIDLGRRRS